jgi:hypothetical protein
MTVGEPPYDRALRAVVALLDALPGPSMLIGGLAVMLHGHVRTTDDIDATVAGAGLTPEQIVARARAYDLMPRIENAVALARRTQVLLLVHQPTGVELDLSLAWVPFEAEALARRVVVRFEDLELHVCGAEDLIIYKVVAARPVDLDDARQLAMRHRQGIDRERVRRVLAEFDEVLEDGRPRLALWQAIERAAFREA